MDVLLRALRKLRWLVRRDKLSDELAEEMAFHQQQAARELHADGVPAAEAERHARRQFGSAARLKDEALEVTSFRFESVLRDVRFAARQLRKSAGFTTAAVLILGLGIGASTAIFSAVNPILFKPLPYPRPNRIMMMWEDKGGTGGGGAWIAFGTFSGLRERNRSFDYLAVMKAWQPAMTGPFEPERFEGQSVSADYFRVLGVAPDTGRDFEAKDDIANGPQVVILSHRLWRRRFAGDLSIIGRTIKLDDKNYLVIGLMPASFDNVLQPDAELWTPLQYDLSQGRAWGHHLRMIGRLKDGVTRAQAKSNLDAAMKEVARQYASGFAQSGGPARGIVVSTLQDDLSREVKPALLAIMVAVILLLLIACVNVTNLLLTRSAQREGELAVRAALGAGRQRLVRQLLTESLLLAACGSMVAIAITEAGVRLVVRLSPADLPRLNAIAADPAVFAFALALTTAIGIVVGLIPALHASRTELHHSAQQASRRTVGGSRWTRAAFVVAEVSLAVVLLVSAGLLLRSLDRLFAVDPGFDAKNVVTMEVQTSGNRYRKDAATRQFFAQALDAVKAVPGVQDAAFTNQLPLSGDLEIYGVTLDPLPRQQKTQYAALRYGITPDYFHTMRIPLRAGRLFTERDTTGAPPVAIVSESFARKEFPGGDPLGRRVQVGGGQNTWYTIVGVVGDIKQSSLALEEMRQVYTPTTQWHWADAGLTLVVRTPHDLAGIVPAVKRAIWSVDKDQPIVRVATMESLVAKSEAQRRFALILFQAFAFAALILAATGIYGVLSGSVVERTREIGVRAALGATPRKILLLILRHGIAMAAVGAALGMAGAAIASRGLVTLLFAIKPIDPATYAAVVALLLAVAAIASWLPAWRAAKVDPAITLRAE